MKKKEIVEKLHRSFVGSEKLRKHIRHIFRNGCMYTVTNSNLLFHASIPLNEDGSLREIEIQGKKYKGKSLLEKVGHLIRTAYFDESKSEEKLFAKDYIWYLWCGPVSPQFDKDKMATFERYYLTDKEAQKEVKGWYNVLKDKKEICEMILDEFNVKGEPRHIINGHIPVCLLYTSPSPRDCS